LLDSEDDFVFNICNIENFNNENSKFFYWFDHLRKNHREIPGDLFEFGVYRGSSLISMALLLKKIKSKKKIYAFDSFSGFPNYMLEDKLENFDSMYNKGLISKDHYDKHKIFLTLKSQFSKGNLDTSNVSHSLDFSDNPYDELERKITLLKLDNIEIVKGSFSETIPAFFDKYKGQVFSANIDCDLYEGYKVTLKNIWPKVSSGGIIYLDEYYSLKFSGARIACTQFFNLENVSPINISTSNSQFERWVIQK